MLNFILIIITKVIESNAILFHINDSQQIALYHTVLGSIKYALKNGVLHPLAIIHTLFRHQAQPFAPSGIFGVNIIRY